MLISMKAKQSLSTEPGANTHRRSAPEKSSAAMKEVLNRIADHMMKPLDRAILGIESAFEEEIGLHQTFGGD